MNINKLSLTTSTLVVLPCKGAAPFTNNGILESHK